MTGKQLQKMGVQRVDTLIDVGANEGQFLFAVLNHFSPRRVVTIEMLPDLAEQLKEKAPDNVQVVQCAVGREPGTGRICRSVFSPASSLLELAPEASDMYRMDLRQFDGGPVAVRTLDDIYRSSGLGHVELLKIDVQGYELNVIDGGLNTLANTDFVMIEANFVPVYRGGSTFSSVFQSLTGLGFHLKNVFDAHSSADDGILIHADALFTRNPG